MKRILVPGVIIAIAILGFHACEIPGVSAGGGSGGSVLITRNGVTYATLEADFPIVLDQGTRTYTERRTDHYCESGSEFVDTFEVNNRYSISGGHLYVWENDSILSTDDCTAEVLNGSSSTLIGTWSSTTFGQAPIPAAYRPEYCDSEVPEVDTLAQKLLRNATVTFTYSTSNRHAKAVGTLCYADFFAAASGLLQPEGAYVVSAPGCSTVEITEPDLGSTATIRSTVSGRKIILTVDFEGNTCSGVTYPADEPYDCSQPDLNDLFSCMNDAGLGKVAAAKKSALLLRRSLFSLR